VSFISNRRWERPDRPQSVYTGALALFEADRYVPIGDLQRQSYRTADRRIDRTFVQQTVPDFGWVQSVVDGQVSAWRPAVDTELASGVRTASRALLDVRAYEWAPSSSSWIYPNLPVPPPTADVLWPAILLGTGLSYRSRDGARLDVRETSWSPQNGWIYTAVFPALPALMLDAGVDVVAALDAGTDITVGLAAGIDTSVSLDAGMDTNITLDAGYD